MIVTMSGACYHEAVAGSGVPAEESWPTPSIRRQGKGRQYVYDVDDRTARLIVSHVLDLYEGLGGYDGAAQDRARLRPFLRRYASILDEVDR